MARTADDSGIASLFRSDHFFCARQADSLEAYISLALAAAETTRLRLGTLVTPIMFRTPVDIGRMAAHIDALSGGRFVLGLGIGWNEEEHGAYGLPFPSVSERFERLEEAIGVCRTLWSPSGGSFRGRYFTLTDVDCRPKPASPRLPILIGGGGERRALRLVAKYADEWCSECLPVGEYRRKVEVLERHCEELSRDPRTIRRSMVVTAQVVPSAGRVVKGVLKHVRDTVRPSHAWHEPFQVTSRLGGFLVGGRQQILDSLAQYAKLGLQEAIFRHYDFDSGAGIEYLGREIGPVVRTLGAP